MDGLPPPELGSRALFPRLRSRAYLSHAAIAPASLLVEAASAEVCRDYAELGVEAFPRWAERRKQLRARLAHLIGAAEEEIALTPGTTHSITQLAFSLPWKPGDRLLLLRGEFPANVTPWQQAAAHFGLELEWLELPDASEFAGGEDPTTLLLEDLERALRRGVRLVATSAVQFQTGLRMPLGAMAHLCREHGAELAVDAIQALGAVPLDVRTEGIDYLACGAHKWLLGLEGAGFTFVRSELASRLVPRLAGWLSHRGGERFLFEGPGLLQYDRPLETSVSVLEGSSSNTLGLAALDASVGALLELGVPAIEGHVQAYLDALEPGLVELGCRSLRAQTRAARSCILSVRLPADAHGPSVVAELRAAGITVSYPDGLVRFAPHFSNSLDEVPLVQRELRRLLGRT